MTVAQRGSHAESEAGATAVEYGILVSLIAALVVLVVGFLGADVLELFESLCGTAPFTGC